MKLYIAQLSPTSYHFIILRAKYCLLHPVLHYPNEIKRFQFVFSYNRCTLYFVEPARMFTLIAINMFS